MSDFHLSKRRKPPEATSNSIEAAWKSATLDKQGLVSFETPGLDLLVRAALDSISDIAGDNSLMDNYNELFIQIAKMWRVSRGPRLHAHSFDSTEGHKYSIEAGFDSFQTLINSNYQIQHHELYVAFSAVEEIRRLLFHGLNRTIGELDWRGHVQTVRAIRYLEGEHEPQVPHTDSPIFAVIALPAGDDRLMVRDSNGGWFHVEAGERGRAVVLPGRAASPYIPGAVAIEHAVARLKRDATRDVATLFIHGVRPTD